MKNTARWGRSDSKRREDGVGCMGDHLVWSVMCATISLRQYVGKGVPALPYHMCNNHHRPSPAVDKLKKKNFFLMVENVPRPSQPFQSRYSLIQRPNRK